MPLVLFWIGYVILHNNPDWFNGADTVATIFLIFALIGTLWIAVVLLIALFALFSDR